MFNSFSTKSTDNPYKNLCLSLITQLSQRVLKALKNEYFDDSKFSIYLISTYKKLIDYELDHYELTKASDMIESLVSYCKKNISLRSSSNEKVSYKKVLSEKVSTARGSNLGKLDRIVEESPRIFRSLRKPGKKVFGAKRGQGVHGYYESMMGKYLKMTLKSPIKGNMESASRSQVTQVQLKDGMFFRLF